MPKPSTHTPGPWSVGVYEATEGFRQIRQHACVCDPETLALIAVLGRAEDRQSQIDADLVAAAPDLLQAAMIAEQYFAGAVERAVSSGCDAPAHLVGPLRLLRAAIAKATAAWREESSVDLPFICDECGGTRVLAAAVPCHVCRGTGRTDTGPETHRIKAEDSANGGNA